MLAKPKGDTSDTRRRRRPDGGEARFLILEERAAGRPKPEKPNTGVSRLMIRLKNQKGRLRIEVKFTPLSDE